MLHHEQLEEKASDRKRGEKQREKDGQKEERKYGKRFCERIWTDDDRLSATVHFVTRYFHCRFIVEHVKREYIVLSNHR